MKSLVCFLLLSSFAFSQNKIIPHSYSVSLKSGYTQLIITSSSIRSGVLKSTHSLNRYGTVLSIQFKDDWKRDEEISWLKNNNSIAYYQPSLILDEYSIEPNGCAPNDPYYQSQWEMQLMKFEDAWCFKNTGLSPFGDTLVVAVIEFGFNFKYKDLIPNIFINHNEIPDNGIDDDLNGYIDDYYGYDSQSSGDEHQIEDHGTQVLSAIGAKGNNKTDISGTNQNIKMLICSGANTTDNLLTCYYYVLEMRRKYDQTSGSKGAFIISSNLSSGIPMGFPVDFPLICQVYDSLGYNGILTSVATINDDADIDVVGDIPGLCPSDYLIVTTSTDRNDRKAEAGFSKINVDMAASGEVVPLIDAQGEINYVSGTSFASPHVAGAIAILYQYCPELTNLNKTKPADAVKLAKSFIVQCGDEIANLKGATVSGRRLNMIKSLQCLDSYCQRDTMGMGMATGCSIQIKNNLQNEPIEIFFNPEVFGTYTVFIYNVSGQLLDQKTLQYQPGSSNIYKSDIYHWPSGVYHVIIKGDNFECSKSLIKI